MRVTLFGASGLLGQELVRDLGSEQDQLTALSSKDADLRDHARVRDVIRDSRPDWTLLLAAYTNVDGCEFNRDHSFEMNCSCASYEPNTTRLSGTRLISLSPNSISHLPMI